MCALSLEQKLKRQMIFEVLKSKTLPIKVKTKSGSIYDIVEFRDNNLSYSVIAANSYARFPLNILNIVEILEE